MLMDEPFGALDAITRRHLQDELRSIQQRLHKTILFVTHDVDEALRLADRIIVMREGKIVQFDTPLHLLEHPVDEFVAQLVAADDLLRRLTLINVAAVMTPLDAGRQIQREPMIKATTDLRSALTLLLSSGADQLMVVDGNGDAVGTVTFERVQSMTREVVAPSQHSSG
jgi:osmoprotectant transport system ATP-binding protein